MSDCISCRTAVLDGPCGSGWNCDCSYGPLLRFRTAPAVWVGTATAVMDRYCGSGRPLRFGNRAVGVAADVAPGCAVGDLLVVGRWPRRYSRGSAHNVQPPTRRRSGEAGRRLSIPTRTAVFPNRCGRPEWRFWTAPAVRVGTATAVMDRYCGSGRPLQFGNRAVGVAADVAPGCAVGDLLVVGRWPRRYASAATREALRPQRPTTNKTAIRRSRAPSFHTDPNCRVPQPLWPS